MLTQRVARGEAQRGDSRFLFDFQDGDETDPMQTRERGGGGGRGGKGKGWEMRGRGRVVKGRKKRERDE